LLAKQEAFLQSGEFVPQAMIDIIRQAETQALAEGFSGLWFAGEMTWALGPEPGNGRLIEYEALLTHLLRNSRSVILGQYNRSRFDASWILDVLRTHPLAILGDQICTNPYCELPEMVLSPEQTVASSDVKRKLVD
jgi:hypothetical protein